MRSPLKPYEVKGKLFSPDPELLIEVQENIRDNYRDVSTSRVLGPDNEGTFWCFINIYRETT